MATLLTLYACTIFFTQHPAVFIVSLYILNQHTVRSEIVSYVDLVSNSSILFPSSSTLFPNISIAARNAIVKSALELKNLYMNFNSLYEEE